MPNVDEKDMVSYLSKDTTQIEVDYILDNLVEQYAGKKLKLSELRIVINDFKKAGYNVEDYVKICNDAQKTIKRNVGADITKMFKQAPKSLAGLY